MFLALEVLRSFIVSVAVQRKVECIVSTKRRSLGVERTFIGISLALLFCKTA